MLCPVFITFLPLLALAEHDAESGHARNEYVSATSLTFEVAEPAPVDRARLLAVVTGDEERERAYEIMAGMDLRDDEGWSSDDEDMYYDSADSDLDGNLDGNPAAGNEESFEEDEDPVEREGAAARFDTTYDSADGVAFFARDAGGTAEMGAPAPAPKPLARRLRRVVPASKAGTDPARALVERGGVGEESSPRVSPRTCLCWPLILGS
jgi:hypothetical protein